MYYQELEHRRFQEAERKIKEATLAAATQDNSMCTAAEHAQQARDIKNQVTHASTLERNTSVDSGTPDPSRNSPEPHHAPSQSQTMTPRASIVDVAPPSLLSTQSSINSSGPGPPTTIIPASANPSDPGTPVHKLPSEDDAPPVFLLHRVLEILTVLLVLFSG